MYFVERIRLTTAEAQLYIGLGHEEILEQLGPMVQFHVELATQPLVHVNLGVVGLIMSIRRVRAMRRQAVQVGSVANEQSRIQKAVTFGVLRRIPDEYTETTIFKDRFNQVTKFNQATARNLVSFKSNQYPHFAPIYQGVFALGFIEKSCLLANSQLHHKKRS